MSLTERVAAIIAKHLYELGGFSGVPEGYVWTEKELRRLDVDGVADCVDLADAAIRATLAALRAYGPLSGWTGTPASLIDAFEREHLPVTPHSTNAQGNVT